MTVELGIRCLETVSDGIVGSETVIRVRTTGSDRDAILQFLRELGPVELEWDEGEGCLVWRVRRPKPRGAAE